MPDPDEIQRYEALLERYLPFYDALRTRARRPKTAAQRQFQDVAWGSAEPVTDHEKAYFYHLTKQGAFREKARPMPIDQTDDGIERYPIGQRPIPHEVGLKWDEEWVDTPGSGYTRRRF